MLPVTRQGRALLGLLAAVITLGLAGSMFGPGGSKPPLRHLTGRYMARKVQLRRMQTAQQQQQQQMLPAPKHHRHEARHIVAAAYQEHLGWLGEGEVAHIPQTVYISHDPAAQHPMALEHAEAGAYLQFILERYASLPEATVFVHAHRTSKHMPDKAPLLPALHWELPFANLRYKGITQAEWGAWTGDWLSPRQPETAPPAPEVVWDELRVNQSRLYAHVWQQLMEAEYGPVPKLVHAPCCSEFLVSKQRILMHPRSFYQHMFDWLAASANETVWYNARYATVFEYMWHIVFGEPVIYHAPERCELLHCH